MYQWTVWDQPHQDHLPHVHSCTPYLLSEHADCGLHRPGQVCVTRLCVCVEAHMFMTLTSQTAWPWTCLKAFKNVLLTSCLLYSSYCVPSSVSPCLTTHLAAERSEQSIPLSISAVALGSSLMIWLLLADAGLLSLMSLSGRLFIVQFIQYIHPHITLILILVNGLNKKFASGVSN